MFNITNYFFLVLLYFCDIKLENCFSQRFAAVIMRIREPRTTALIFSSGKMVCTGAKRYSRQKKQLTVLLSGLIEIGFSLARTLKIEGLTGF